MSKQDPAANGVVPRPAIERLLSKLSRDEATGCEVWTGALDHKGYARIAVGGHRNRLAHRVAYEAAKGSIPPGLTLDHLCRNKACCNPEHLEPVTFSVNTKRKAHPTLCPAGHELSGDNLRLVRGGTTRCCRACKREHKRAERLRAKMAAGSDNQSDAQERSPVPPISDGCSRCGETDFSPNVEAFELSGETVCDDCAAAVFEANSQFGEGA